MLTPEALEELSKLEASATPGPWKVDMGNWTIETENEEFYRAEICGIDWSSRNNLLDDHPNPVHPYRDGEFIAAIRNAAKELIAMAKDADPFYRKLANRRELDLDTLTKKTLALEAKLAKAKAGLEQIQSLKYGVTANEVARQTLKEIS